MKSFNLVNRSELNKINKEKLKRLSPERQVKAIRLWVDQNIRKYGPCGTQNTDDEMRNFILEAGKNFGLNINSSFETALRYQKAWSWTDNLIDRDGNPINLQNYKFDSTEIGVLKKIIEDKGGNSHGDTFFNDQARSNYPHWTCGGSKRIFGSFANGKFTLIGFGKHIGKDNKKYNIDLILGGTVKAATKKEDVKNL